jgi:hypothetical protein
MKKIIVEQNGEKKEVSQDKLEEMRVNPDFQVDKKEETTESETYNVKQRLYD